MKPLCIDLFCGLGGWTEGFLAEGYDVVGFDIERHQYGEHKYPAQLVIQDVLTLHGSQFKNAAVIVASPPCQEFSHYAMPFGALWEEHNRMDDDGAPAGNYLGKGTVNRYLFQACFRIASEAGVPVVIENVKGAQPWVGRASWHYGSFYLWGNLPALMPSASHRKVGGFNFHQYEKTGQPGGSFQTAAVKNSATAGGSWFNVSHGKIIPGNQAGAPQRGDGLKQAGLSGPLWFDHGAAAHSSKSASRKSASALIAKIPFELSSHIARCFKPRKEAAHDHFALQKEGSMSDSITFRGAILKHFDVRQGKEGGDVFCRIHMSSDYSEQVREKMEWGEIPDSVTECKLSGSLLATNFILTPGDKQLRQYELNFDISSCEDFSVVAVRNDDGDICGRELRFVVRTPKDGVEGFVGNYIRRVGRHGGALKIRYTVQEELDLGAAESKPAEDEEVDTGCISCNNGLPFADAAKTTHENGVECTREQGSSTLASAREAAGGTHAKKRGRPRKEEPVPVAEEEAEAVPVN